MIDQNAAAGALVERSRAQGIVVGTGVEMLRMNFVPVTADVKAGDTIVTSGVDGIYPKGFVIGKVEQVDNGNGIYKAIRVRPSVEFNRARRSAGGEDAAGARPRRARNGP